VCQAYVDLLSGPQRVHAICEEYRGAPGIDREDDNAEATAGRRITCPTFALWSARGGLNRCEIDGGPIGIWWCWCEDVEGESIDGGHFVPEELPDAITDHLPGFALSLGWVGCSASPAPEGIGDMACVAAFGDQPARP
jgi:haloacetate dehalogenase